MYTYIFNYGYMLNLYQRVYSKSAILNQSVAGCLTQMRTCYLLSGVLTASSINLVIIVAFSKIMFDFLGSKITVNISFNKNAQNLNLFGTFLKF